MKRKRLSDSEIRSAVDKIRKRYGDYMVQFMKERSALDSFEERYIQAMRARLELALFLHAEMTAVEELIKKEQDRINAEEQKALRAKVQKEESKSYADRILEENRRRIVKYPPLQIHADASEEVERLFGCLITLERQYWPDVEKYMRSAYTASVLSPRMRLEQRIIGLCRPTADGLPPRLSRYRSLFDWVPRNGLEIEKEGKKCLLEAAFFLHDLSDVLKEMKESGNLQSYEQKNVDNLLGYVHTLLEDFRLKDLKAKPR
ncbi:MAG: hypothetical protein JW852_04510 [Spirochaetales bacterium]|nr:hypothetical protein [Spirochaetales bacterium]